MSGEDLTQITNHEERALSVLISQFKGQPNFESFIKALVVEAQEIEGVLWQLATELALNTAVGEQLDGIGEIVGEPRRGKNDAEYRSVLSFRISINISSGQPEIMIDALSAVTESTIVQLVELYPATIIMYFNGAVLLDDLVEKMVLIKPAGVTLSLVSNLGQTAFTFEGDPDGLGFSDVGFPINGIFSEGFA